MLGKLKLRKHKKEGYGTPFKLVEELIDHPHRSIRLNTSNCKEIGSHINQLLDQPFLKTKFSYGDELVLHFGIPQEYSSPRLKDQFKGSHIIATRASNWFLGLKGSEIIFDLDDELKPSLQCLIQPMSREEVEAQSYIKHGTKIIEIVSLEISANQNLREGILSLGLFICLENDSFLLVIPDVNTQSDGGDDIADWELFMPNSQYLRVGPGLKWSYRETKDLSRMSS